MASFRSLYEEIFATFGYPLTAGKGVPTAVLEAAERRLGVRVPAALRDYYAVAGRERRFNTSLNRLLPPSRWEVDRKRLIFMDENQYVVRWGVSIRNPDSEDPPVSQAIPDEELIWQPEHRRCSVFLAVMLHYQAVSDGMPFCGGGEAPEETDYRFERHGWKYYGTTGGILAHSRPNQVVCLQPPGDLPFMRNWWVLVGAKTRRDRQVIADELGIALA